MSFNNTFTAVVGATYTAAQYNTYVRDNFTAIWVGTTAGDMDYYTSATAKARLAIGAAGSIMQSNGSVPSWLAIGAAYKALRSSGSAPAWEDLHFACVYNTTTQNLTSGAAAAAITFNSEYSDVLGWHSTSSNTSRITVSVTGYYVVSCFAEYAGVGGSGYYMDSIEMHVDGVFKMRERAMREVDATYKSFSKTFPIYPLTAGQYVEIKVQQNSGSLVALQGSSVFSVWRVA